MAKMLLIKTPETIDGRTLLYDENRQVVFKETLAPLASKTHHEALNAKRPKELRDELLEVDVDENGEVIKAKSTNKKAE